MQKSVFRNLYEMKCGQVSDRQWLRIRTFLKIREVGCLSDRVTDQQLGRIKAYGDLRLLAPKGKITLEDVDQYVKFSLAFPSDCQCSGADLIAGIQKVLDPSPSRSRCYAWGDEIGIPLSTKRWYGRDEIRTWIGKLLSLQRFRIKSSMSFRGIDQLAA